MGLAWASPHWACLGLVCAGPNPLCPQKASMGPARTCLQGTISYLDDQPGTLFTFIQVDLNDGLCNLQVSQRALRAQQLLQLQVIQLQQDKERLQEEVDQLNRDRDTAESRLRIYESQNNLAPTLEETQWEVNL